MISFNDQRLYVKGTCQAQATDPTTGQIVYYSNKFQTGNITTSVTMGEIRAGLGNAVAAIIPSDSALNVEFTSADFSLWAKAAQLGGSLNYNAPTPVCEVVTATGTTLTVDVTSGIPVAPLGQSEVRCYVQKVGESSKIGVDGVPYAITSAGQVQGFTATSGAQYKVWYWVNKASSQVATISTLFDPKTVYFTAQVAVYANSGAASSGNEGTRVGWLYIIVPFLKLGANGGIVGDQSNNDTTSMSGQAVAYDETKVSAACSDCAAGTMAYYIYAPDDESSAIEGLAVVGGVVSATKSATTQIPVQFVMANGQLVRPATYATGFTFTASGAPSGTTVSNAGVITAGSTTGDFDVAITYTSGSNVYNATVAVSVV